jgi:hypothetical protein
MQNPILDNLQILTGAEVWVKNVAVIGGDAPFVPGQIRDVEGEEVLVKIAVGPQIKKWVPRVNVFPRWGPQADKNYRPEQIHDLQRLPLLNKATISLHVLNRDFVWLAPKWALRNFRRK